MNKTILALAVLCMLVPTTTHALTYDDLNEQERRFVQEYVIGNVTFTLLHEVGHMLIDRYSLPVLGKEEDAVDAFATVVLLESPNAITDNALIYSSKDWLVSSRQESRPTVEQYAGVHSLHQQRAYNIACMMIGKDYYKFVDAARAIEYPETAMENCANVYAQANASWTKLLSPHVADDRQSRIIISSEKATGDQDQTYSLVQEWVSKRRILEAVGAMVSHLFKLDESVKIQAEYCSVTGDPLEKKAQNAFWHVDQSQIRYCFELAASQLLDAVDIVQAQRAQRIWVP